MAVMYMCEHCGAVFSENEGRYEDKETGFCGIECPVCHEVDYYSEAEECKGCGEYFRVDELHEGYCDKCTDKMLYDGENVRNYITDACDIDDFWELLKSNYPDSYLMEVLYEEFSSDARDFCSDDIDDFVQFCTK